jgi:hypothetical protein
MPFSFDPTLPTLRDHARLALSDLDAAAPLLDDGTMDAKLSQLGYLEGLAQLADALAVRAAQDPNKYAEGAAGLSAEWSQRVESWRRLAEDCRSGAIQIPTGIRRPGISVDELSRPSGMRTD